MICIHDLLVQVYKMFFFQVDTTITVFHIILFQNEVKIEEF